MTLTHFAIIAVCAYLFGSLSFAIIVSKVTLGKDIRNYGSGNAGLTNFYRTYGAKYALGVILFDMGKTVIACLMTAINDRTEKSALIVLCAAGLPML